MTVADIDATYLLDRRECPPPDFQKESASLSALARLLTTDRENIKQQLAETAMRLTGAHSTGLSLEEEQDGRCFFRWVAAAGSFAKYLNGTVPRDFSPCGEVLDRGAAVLLREPARLYTFIEAVEEPIIEVLLVPFYKEGKAIGTLWAVSHNNEKTFHAEDLRILKSLTDFAAAAVQTVGLLNELRRANQHKDDQIAQLQTWFEQSPGFVAYLSGPQHIFEMANDAYRLLVGRDNLVGKPVREALPELNGQGFEELLDRVFKTGQPYHGREDKVILRGPEDRVAAEKYVDFIYQPIFGRDQKVMGILVQGNECTERKYALDQLRQIDKRKDDFLAVLSHELRCPLNTLRMSSQLLQRSPNDELLRQRYIAVIERQAVQMSALVNDIGDIASIKSGKLRLKIETVTLQEIIARALEATWQQLHAKEQKLELSMPQSPIVLQADSLRLTQVFINLINNAIKYTPAGGRIDVTVSADEQWTIIAVKDTGIGILPELLPRIFDMFMQVPMEERPAHSGVGVGLALVQRFVDLHHGRVEAQSAGPGAGSEFRVYLPLRTIPP